MNWNYVMKGIILSNKENLLTVGKLLGVESKTLYEICNNGWNRTDIYAEGRKLCDTFQIKLLTGSVQSTQILINKMMYKDQRFTIHPNKI